jgi:hypothetical protein
MVTDAVRKRGLTGPNALHNFADMLLGPDPKRRVVLIVDQFEELFSKTTDADQRRAFISFITQAANESVSRLIVLIAIRTEFLAQCAVYPELQQLIGKHGLALEPMAPQELARAIILPALEAGVKIEPQLVARLVRDAQGDPAMLPRLQGVLRNLFLALPHKQGTAMTMTLADYVDFGPLRPSEDDEPAVEAVAAGVSSPQARPFSDPITSSKQVSYFAGLERRVRTFRIVSAVCIAVAALAAALTAFALIQSNQSNTRAMAAATAEAIAQAGATRAVQSAGVAGVARGTAEAQAAQAVAERESAIATRAVAEAASTQAVQDRVAALNNEATAVALATSVVNREQNAVQMEATISAVATRSGAEVSSAMAARATAEVDLKTTRSRELAAVALTQIENDPQLAFLIASEAEKTQHTPQSEDAIQRIAVAAAPNANVFRHNGAVTDARLSPDGKLLLTASRDGLARIWDIASGDVITALRGHAGAVTSASFSPDGKRVLTSSTDRTARLWDVSTGRVIDVLAGHTGTVNDAAFSPDGALAVTGGGDKTARVWDLGTGKLITAPIQFTAVVSTVAFLDTGQIGVRGANGAEKFDARTGADAGPWETGGFPFVTTLANGTLSLQPDGGGGPINLYGHTARAALTDDVSGMIVTAGADGTARVHLVRLDDLLSRIQSVIGRELTCDERVRYLSESIDCAAPVTPAPAPTK